MRGTPWSDDQLGMYARSLPKLALVAIVLAACGDHAASADAIATASPLVTTVPAAPLVEITPTPIRTPYGGAPVPLGADAAVGMLSGGLLGGYRYDGATGTVQPDASISMPNAYVSPSRRWRLEGRNVMRNGLFERTDLWLIDTTTGAERVLYSPPADGSATVQPNPNLPAYVFERTERVGSWSPDERYLTLWEIGLVSASMDADGRPFVVIEVATGAITRLGQTLYQNAWRAPHTLAYVAGGGRETWLKKTLRTWTPEDGTRDVTASGEVGLNPTWGPDGRLWFVNGPEGQYDPPTFFAGHGVGDRSIIAVDLSTRVRTRFPRTPGYADEGIRISDDGKTALVVRRKLIDKSVQADGWVEIWSAKADGSNANPLVRISAYGGFGYYGGFDSLTRMSWVR